MKVSVKKVKKGFSSFIKGIISLVSSQILIKIFGAIYSIYMTNKSGFGDEGNAIYMSGYQIYALLLTISSIGIPNAISKIISEKKSEKDYINMKRTIKISILLFSTIGFLGCVFLFVGSEFIANEILEIPEAKLSLMVLSPAILFVSITSVIRGFFNGENSIFITAKSQFLEQVMKTFFTILFIEIVSKMPNNSTEKMAGIANFATTLATLLSLIYVVYKYFLYEKRNINLDQNYYKRERILHIIKKILRISIPMTITAILGNLGKNIDSVTVVRILKNFMSEEEAIIKYGILSSKVDIIMVLPLSFNIAISTALIPEISKRKAINDLNGISKKIEFSILMTMIIAVPASIGIFSYSKQIFYLLFPKAQNGSELLKLASLGIIFSLLTQTINGILQGLGKNKIPVYAAILGVFVKIISNIVFIQIKGIYEKGAIIGNILSSIASFIVVSIHLRKSIYLKFSIIKMIFKPILSSIIMIFISLNLYNFMIINNLNNNFSTIFCILIAVISYIVSGFVTKMLKKDYFLETVENSRL